MREKQNLVRLFVNGRWMLLISILMTIIQWGSCGHVLDAAGLRSSLMKASLFLWLLTMPLIRLSLQRQLVLFPILLLTWCFIMWIAIFNVVFFSLSFLAIRSRNRVFQDFTPEQLRCKCAGFHSTSWWWASIYLS